jgi:hypothetical protein
MIALYRPASGVHGIGWQAALLWLAWRQFESNPELFPLQEISHIKALQPYGPGHVG